MFFLGGKDKPESGLTNSNDAGWITSSKTSFSSLNEGCCDDFCLLELGHLQFLKAVIALSVIRYISKDFLVCVKSRLKTLSGIVVKLNINIFEMP